MDLAVADIGGTNARFASATIAGDGSITIGPAVSFKTNRHASLRDAWTAYLQSGNAGRPTALAMGVAAPLGAPSDTDHVIRFTNSPWSLRPASIAEEFGMDAVTLVNDFEAIGHAVARAQPGAFAHVAGPDKPLPRCGAISIIGPGTGLGVALLLRDERGYRVQATEGGHIGFAPVDAFEERLLARLRQRHGRVSVERVVSGPGIAAFYSLLRPSEDESAQDPDDVDIWTKGLGGEDEVAARAVERFVGALGSVCGDVALVHGGFSGVVISGGVGKRLRDALPGTEFAARFCAKGRYESLMARIPVKLLLQPEPGLFGAAAAFAAEHGIAP
jgi:glucokinase